MIRVENLHVTYYSTEGTVNAVKGIDITVERGQFFTMLGPSGCGKTTTLRSIAGLERPSGGRISIGDKVVFDAASGVMVPPYRRDIGMVFQSYAIWPHLDVFSNVAFPLQEMKGRFNRDEIRDKVMRALELVQLSGYEKRPAPFLSGGQQQRLALARALVRESEVLLLDEPLSNLDAKLREETRTEIRDLVKRLGITTVYVTHDQLEALTMSDVIAVMDQGVIVQQGSPIEIYQTPRAKFVADFIGLTNFISGKVEHPPKNGSDRGVVATANGRIECTFPGEVKTGDPVVVVIRPEDVVLDPTSGMDAANVIKGRVEAAIFMGDSKEIKVRLADSSLRLKVHPSKELTEGGSVTVSLPIDCCRALPN